MLGRNFLEGRTGQVTQSIDAIKSLLAYVGRASDPMPSDVILDNGRLVRDTGRCGFLQDFHKIDIFITYRPPVGALCLWMRL